MVTMKQAVGIFLVVLVSSAVEVTSNPIFGDLHAAATTPYTHISSFLNQRRSTTHRTDKPDVTSNFELDVGTTTGGPTISRLQIFKFPVIGDIRDRESNAIGGERDGDLFANSLQLEEAKPDSGEMGDTTTEFVGLSLDEDSDGPNVVFETTNSTSEKPGSLAPEEGATSGDSFFAAKFKNKTRAIATFVLTPLLRVWAKAQQNLHFPTVGGGSDDTAQDSQEQEMDEPPSMDSMQSQIVGGSKQSFREAPFRAAFSKHSLAGRRHSNNDDSPAPGSPEAARRTEANLDRGGLDDDDDKPPVPTDGPRLMLTEGLGIYVLEIIGTIVGLTWGAISQLQNAFGGGRQ